MRSTNYRSATLTAGRVAAIVTVLAGMTGWSHASESDLSTSVAAPTEAYLNQSIPVSVGYTNTGPDAADSAYVNCYVPSGVPARLDELTEEQWIALQASATGTDTLGNAPLLFEDERYCEHLFFQLQRDDDDDDPNSVEGLDPGVSAFFAFELEIPMEAPRYGRLSINEPTSLARVWRPALTESDHLEAGERNLYSRGPCIKLVGEDDESVCDYIIDNCFGQRVSLMDPIETEFELVADESANPSYGCGPLVGFTPGNIAVIRRGACDFDIKSFNAYQSGAPAAIIVNDGRCGNEPESRDCVIEFYGGWNYSPIPAVMLAESEGEAIVAAIERGETVRGVIGPQIDDLVIDSLIFLADSADEDPDPTDNQAGISVTVTAQIIEPPTASFIFEPALLFAGIPIRFSDTSTFNPTSWLWSFGDGSAGSTEKNPSHTFLSPGPYTVTLTVANSAGSNSTSSELTVDRSGLRRHSGRRIEPDAP